MRQLKYSLLVVLTALSSWAQGTRPMSHEEEIVRRTYARLTYAAQLNDIYELWQAKGAALHIDPSAFQLRMAEELRFDLSNFRVGKIADIMSTPYKDLVTKPDPKAGDALDVNTGLQGTTNRAMDGTVTHGESWLARARWIPSQTIGENWNLAFGTIYPLTEVAGQHQRYAAFTVTVHFQKRSRTYRAMFLFGPNDNPIHPVDTVVDLNGSAVSRFLAESPYPGLLIEGGIADHDPLIRSWLKAQQTNLGAPGSVYCDPHSGLCGIHEEDFKKLKPISYRFPRKARNPYLQMVGFHSTNMPFIYAQATDCTKYNSTNNLPTGSQSDNTDHTCLLCSGSHSVSVTKGSTCTYKNPLSGSLGACDSQCNVSVTPATSETGVIDNLCHKPAMATDLTHGNATGNGATSCSGAGGGAVKSCFACACSISLTVSTDGVSVTIKDDGFFDFKDGTSNSCPSQQVPTNGGGGNPGGCTPNPDQADVPAIATSNNAAALLANGPVGSFIQNLPPDPPPPCTVSPILVDVEGEGFHLTSADDGVRFDIRGDGQPIQMAWTALGFRNAFLALPESDGQVHSGKDLFGNYTSQPRSAHPNGFLALAEYDKPENGGNGDGIIDERDQVFSQLRLWIDENHDGISQFSELHTLPELGVYSLALHYYESRRTDDFGNHFRYRGLVNPGERRDPRDDRTNERGEVGRWAYDVFFVTK